jgi:tetratricopeptide (TPR) repeat protein
MVYPRWRIDSGQLTSYLPLLAVLVILAILWLKRGSWARPWFFVFAYFLVALFPVLGLINNTYFRYSFVADHFQYLASIGPLALAGAGLARFLNFILAGKRWLQMAICAVPLFILGAVSWERSWAYENEEMLWTDTLAKNPNCWAAHNNLGVILFKRGSLDDAMNQYQDALALNPDYPQARTNLGGIFFQRGQPDLAITQYQTALTIDPAYAEAHYDLANALMQKERLDEAIAQYKEAIEINPNYLDARNELGNILLHKRQADQAIAQYQKVLEIDPRSASACNGLGIAFLLKGQNEKAVDLFRQALHLEPDYKAAQDNLANAEAMMRQSKAHP